MGDTPRVVLVEFVTPGRFHGSSFFPFVKGFLQSGGVPVRWLRFALDPAVQFGSDEQGMRLGDDDRASLAAAVAAVRAVDGSVAPATHVAFFPLPAAALVRDVRSAGAAGCAVAVLSDATEDAPAAADATTADSVMICGVRVVIAPGPEAPSALASTPRAVLAWVRPDARGDDLPAFLVEHPTPDYGLEPANDGARAMRPFVYLFGGRGCTYLSPLAESDFFAARPHLGVPERWGCSFCMVPVWDERAGLLTTPPEKLLRQQLAAIAATHPPSAAPREYKLTGTKVVADPVRLAHLVLEFDLPPGRFLVDYRADWIERMAEPIREAALLLHERGHRLQIFLVGMESFSARQLDRFHKGFGPAASLRALRVLRRLEAEHPDAFGFREYGGLSTILFEPWTTLADLALNLAIVRLFRLEKLCGKLLISRLRLHDGIPLYQAARDEGLLADRFDDPALETARRNFYPDELPWRFVDARVETFNRLAARLEPDDAMAGDPLYEALHAWGRDSGLGLLDRAERLLQATAAAPAGTPPEAVFAAARALAPARQESTTNAPDAAAIGSAGWIDARTDLTAFADGRKPVVKIEGTYGEDEVGTIERGLRARFPSAVVLRRRRGAAGAPGTDAGWEVFAGRDRAAVEETVALTARAEEERDPAALADVVARIGERLGYPPCCARAFADEPAFFQQNNEWLRVKRRLAADAPDAPDAADATQAAAPAADGPGAVSVAAHPVLTGYVPCALDCPRTTAEVAPLALHPPGGLPAEALRYPVLLLLDRPGDHVMLKPLEPVSERFRYEASYARTDDPRLAALRDGDTLEVEPGLVRVLRRGRETASFALDAFLWWHERVFHADFWRECVRELEDPILTPEELAQRRETTRRAAEAAAPKVDDHAPPPDPHQDAREALRAHVAAMFARMAAHPKRLLRGFALAEAADRRTGASWGEVTAALQRGPDRLTLRILPREAVRQAFCLTDHFALMHEEDTPADTDEKRHLIQLVGRALERYLYGNKATPQRLGRE